MPDASDITRAVGRILDAARRAQGLTLDALGKHLGRDPARPMSRQGVARITVGQSCSIASLFAACEALGLDPADVLEGLELAAGEPPGLSNTSVAELCALARQLGTTAADLLRAVRR
jgi:transcriptional regulator with XRE-family HTH domain